MSFFEPFPFPKTETGFVTLTGQRYQLVADFSQDLVRRTRFVQAVEVQTGRAAVEELPALADGEIDARFECLFRIFLDRSKHFMYLFGHGGPAQRAEFDEAWIVGDRQDAGDDAVDHSQLSQTSHIIKIILVVEEQLGDHKIRPGVGFFL